VRKRSQIAAAGCDFADRLALCGLEGFCRIHSPEEGDGAISGQGLGRMQESLGIDARCQERLAYHETDGNRRIIKDTAFAGGNACSTTAEAGRVHAIRAVITWGAVFFLVCGNDVTHHPVRGACRECRNAGNHTSNRAGCRSLPDDTARDQENHGQQ
jgi:hypothetical protein